MSLRDRKIAVIGAGIGGLAAAIALAQRHARVTVFEQAPALAEVGAGLQVAPNGVAVLEALGLRDAAAPVASSPPSLHLRDGISGRSVARLPLGAAVAKRHRRPYWQFHRADLLAVLAGALPRWSVRLRLAAPAVVVQAGAHDVLVRHPEGQESFEAVIAADGVRSATRAAHFAGAPPRYARHAAWRGLVPAGALAAPPEETILYMGPGRHLVAYPLRNGRVINVVAVERRAEWVEEGWTHPDLPATARAAFAGWAEPVRDLLGALPETFLWGLFDHPPLPAWSRGRLALLGDACHPMLPFLAQGATMALEDAWVLAAELDRADDPAEGLARYERRRKPRATHVQRAAARNGAIYHLRQPLRPMAQLGLTAAGRWAPELLLRRFDWIYGLDVTAPDAAA